MSSARPARRCSHVEDDVDPTESLDRLGEERVDGGLLVDISSDDEHVGLGALPCLSDGGLKLGLASTGEDDLPAGLTESDGGCAADS